jgi:hypothetical protein
MPGLTQADKILLLGNEEIPQLRKELFLCISNLGDKFDLRKLRQIKALLDENL